MEVILAIRTGLPDTWNEKLAGETKSHL